MQRPTSSNGPAVADLQVVEPAVSPSSSAAMARFEFETGRGNEGTKILMVEWDLAAIRDPLLRHDLDGWDVLWEGKGIVHPVPDTEQQGLSRRFFFLLPPGAAIPGLVTISQNNHDFVKTKPLPAIFPPGLGAASLEIGTRGVLHTMWAKRRLAVLQDEIDAEMRANGEGVGLVMALQERDWVLDHFDLGHSDSPMAGDIFSLPMAKSPRSPVGGRLGEKLKGLRLATSPAALIPSTAVLRNWSGDWKPQIHSTSPRVFAISSSSMLDRSRSSQSAPSSDFPRGGRAPPMPGGNDIEEGLFALPLSPRSPEMTKSPFSLL